MIRRSPAAYPTYPLFPYTTLFRSFYYYGIIHGDATRDNYTIRPDGTVNLLDFGCIRVFPPKFVKGVIDLYFALERDDPELAVEAYRIWGFTDLSKDLLAALNLWAAFLYAPLLEDKPQKIMGDHGSLYGAKVAGDRKSTRLNASH